LDQEAEITKRLLDIVPEDKLTWRPHPKARSLGELAMHLAHFRATSLRSDSWTPKETGTFPSDSQPASRAQILEVFAENLKKAKNIVAVDG
jgi:hypothetical protein